MYTLSVLVLGLATTTLADTWAPWTPAQSSASPVAVQSPASSAPAQPTASPASPASPALPALIDLSASLDTVDLPASQVTVDVSAGAVRADVSIGGITLGSAAPFGISAATTITSTGNTVVTGQMGIYPNGMTSITGFGPGKSGTQYGADSTAQNAQTDLTTAYNKLAAMTPTESLTGQDLGGMTLRAGVYNFASSGGLTGKLTLDAQGDSNAQFVFQFGSTITTATSSSVIIVNGGRPCNVFWQVGSSATLGTSTTFIGNVLALTSITANSGISNQGGLFALNAAVTMIDVAVTAPGTCN